eukprot:2247773-Prymnesium_polylepis.1
MVGTGTGVPRSEKGPGGAGYTSAELSVGLDTLIFLARKRLESPVWHWLPLGRVGRGPKENPKVPKALARPRSSKRSKRVKPSWLRPTEHPDTLRGQKWSNFTALKIPG